MLKKVNDMLKIHKFFLYFLIVSIRQF